MKKLWNTWVKSFINWATDIGRNLWEDYLKEKLMEDIKELVQEAIKQADVFRASDTYIQQRDAILKYIFDKIKLPLFLKPFKGAIKAILAKNIDAAIDKEIEKIKGRIQ